MIANLPPYSAYKPSGVEWLDDVPAQWEVRPLKHWVGINETVLSEATDSDFGFDYLEIGAVSAGVLTDEPRRIRFGDAPSRARRVVSRGDTIVSTVRSYLKAVWFANETDSVLICSTGFAVLTPRQGTIPQYVGYLVQSCSFIDQMTAESVGIAYPAISEGRFSSSRVCIPPLAEQRAIARYLDHVDRRIQRYIEAKEKLIALLQEARQATIQRAVTRGLDPGVPLKPSGVDWLGDVPAHWEVRRLRTLGEAIIGLTYSPQDVVDEEEGTLVLRASNISEGRIVYGDNVYVRCSVPDRLVAQVGDILICSRSGSRALIGKNARIDSALSGATFGAFMTIFRSKHNDYLHCIFNSKLFEYQSGAFLTSTINQLTLGILNNFKIPWPPLAEQKEIAAHVDKTTAGIDAAIDNARRQVGFMIEYRASLIAHVVTGKLDVRAAAEHLPQEARELAVS
ncbi:MAG: restriction endonuclease subunit S [Caldilineaceae bacterium SB0668_bin_21]|nr:restriction endonuclease subunit S [Caldilineaceae bacterium SB0668_bin_21]MYC20371.1 restriction endonuclease subunit S [Caldilineaceae bacterium SB0662_bin_25]